MIDELSDNELAVMEDYKESFNFGFEFACDGKPCLPPIHLKLNEFVFKRGYAQGLEFVKYLQDHNL